MRSTNLFTIDTYGIPTKEQFRKSTVFRKNCKLMEKRKIDNAINYSLVVGDADMSISNGEIDRELISKYMSLGVNVTLNISVFAVKVTSLNNDEIAEKLPLKLLSYEKFMNRYGRDEYVAWVKYKYVFSG